jgi:deoxyribose-phosphate aldolase
MPRQKANIAPLDLLLLDPALTAEETRAGCVQAERLSLASVVVKPCFVRQAAAASRCRWGRWLGTRTGPMPRASSWRRPGAP